MEDKMVTIYIGGYPRRCPESRVPLILENIEKIKQYYAEKGAPKDMVEAAYCILRRTAAVGAVVQRPLCGLSSGRN